MKNILLLVFLPLLLVCTSCGGTGKKGEEDLQLSLEKKGYVPANIMKGQVQEYITATIRVKNTSDKDIRAFNGTLTFKDLLDKKVLSMPYTFDEGVRAGSETLHKMSLEYNQFIDSHIAFRKKEVDQLNIDFEVKDILFAEKNQEAETETAEEPVEEAPRESTN